MECARLSLQEMHYLLRDVARVMPCFGSSWHHRGFVWIIWAWVLAAGNCGISSCRTTLEANLIMNWWCHDIMSAFTYPYDALRIDLISWRMSPEGTCGPKTPVQAWHSLTGLLWTCSDEQRLDSSLHHHWIFLPFMELSMRIKRYQEST